MVIGDGIIPEAQCVYDVRDALSGRGDVVLLAHVAATLGQTIPEGSTIYNLEPLFDGCRSLSLGYMDVLRSFPVWDYQAKNVEYLNAHGVDALHVPYGYTPALERAAPAANKDIDVLFIGSMTPRRRAVLDDIGRVCNVTEVQGCYGRALDCAIARAKVVVNIHYCGGPHPLEVVRLNYLMANACCVVSEPGWDEDDVRRYGSGVFMTSDVANTCAELLLRPRDIASAGRVAREVIRSMPMRVPQPRSPKFGGASKTSRLASMAPENFTSILPARFASVGLA